MHLMQRTRLIGANWKMNPPPPRFDAPDSPYRSSASARVIVFPSLLDIPLCKGSGIESGAQCARPEDAGAFTGDVSVKQIKNAGCSAVLCGHSERRHMHGESDALIALQVKAGLENGLTTILCIGETAKERDALSTNACLERQLQSVLSLGERNLTTEHFVIAYEPVWAIGTGMTPTPDDVVKTHAFIRSLLPSDDIRILYGGSVTGANAGSFLSAPGVDGALVGGASLKPSEFEKIVRA